MATTTICTNFGTGSLITEVSNRRSIEEEPACVVSSIGYLKKIGVYETEKPYYCNVPLPNGRQSNIVSSRHANIALTNIRPSLLDYTLDVQGFEVIKYDGEPYSPEDFSSDSWIEQIFYPMIENVLLKRFGNVVVKIFDHTVRRRDPATNLLLPGEHLKRQPSMAAHVDQTFLSGVNRIKLHMGDDAAGLLKGRCQIVKYVRGSITTPFDKLKLSVYGDHYLDL